MFVTLQRWFNIFAIASQGNNHREEMDQEPVASSNQISGGFGRLFRSADAGSSNSELTGVTPPGVRPLSPYLNIDPKYLIQGAEEFILPTGANKTRGRFELAFFTIGSCCVTGALFGAISGLRMGLSETRNMAWSKPRNVQILNLVTRVGGTWANTLGSVALLYSAFGVIIEKTRGAEDDLNTMAAGTMTGILYKSPGGLRGAVRGGMVGFALSGLYALYTYWDHLKGGSATRY